MTTTPLSRRTLITGLAATVIGYNTTTRTWATTTPTTGHLATVPTLDGTLTTDTTTLTEFSHDFGRLTTTTPTPSSNPAPSKTSSKSSTTPAATASKSP